MLDIEIDGKALQVEDGSTIMDAARAAGVFIPHFCYHKKLSIAANCRMCLVQVEKAPKPLPACATPVTNGMKVFTHSNLAVTAQKGVMEFLLINHPLDCPVCDQGGECLLQDLAVGYGGDATRYQEAKRVVVNKNLGPLVSTDMTRCINCTRCVRFTQEIAGRMELGQAFRGDRAEIMPFLEGSLESELSGNIIDLCPVGALTSRPFRYTARTWELSRRRSVSPHDSLGSNLIVQGKLDRVYRVVPQENEEINECWLADRDRFSYEALNSPERLQKPMVKQGGQWHEVEWNVALDYASHALRSIARNHGPAAVGALVSPHSTLEEMALAGRLVRGIGSGNIDHRLRRSDFSADGKGAGAPWLGMPIAEVSTLQRVLVVGSFLRKDHPLLAQRLRQAARRGAQVSLIHSAGDDPLMPVHALALVAPDLMPEALAAVVKAAAQIKGAVVPASLDHVAVSPEAQRIAESLASAADIAKCAVFLGNFAGQHAQAGLLHALAQELARIVGCRFGFLHEAANSVGGHLAGAIPDAALGGLDACRMIESPRKAYVLLHAEPDLDCADPRAAVAAMKQAESVVVLSAFKHPGALEYADVLLPVAPFTETSGTFVNAEGRAQSFNGVARIQGEARPAWKVLRVLGNLLELPGFDQEASEDVRDAVLGAGDLAGRLDNAVTGIPLELPAAAGGMQRVADVPGYFADPLVRRAPSLQKTPDAAYPVARVAASDFERLGLEEGGRVRLKMGEGSADLVASRDEKLAPGCVRVPTAHPATAGLGAMSGTITVERA